MSSLFTRIRHKRDTKDNWSSNNPILLEGELGFESDTNKFKLGDGVSNWNDLDYIITESPLRTIRKNYTAPENISELILDFTIDEADSLLIFQEGILLIPDLNYTIEGSIVTFKDYLVSKGDHISVVYIR